MSTDLVPHTGTALAAHPNPRPGRLAALTRDQVDLIKQTVAKGATDTELQMFLEQAQARGLNPFTGQIWAIKRREKVGDRWIETTQTQVGVAGLTLIAERTGKFGGFLSTEYCGPDEVWRKVWMGDVATDPPVACRVVGRRTDWPDPYEVIVYWREFAQTTRGGDLTAMWRDKGLYMLAKCARAAFFRHAFPEELAGLEVTYDDGPAMNQATLRVMQDAQHQLETGEPRPAPGLSIADVRYQRLVQVARSRGLDPGGMVEALAAAGLERPNARTLGDTPTGQRNFDAMLHHLERGDLAVGDEVIDDDTPTEGDPVHRDPDGHDHGPADGGQQTLDGAAA